MPRAVGQRGPRPWHILSEGRKPRASQTAPNATQGEQGSCPDSNREPLKLSEQMSTVLAAVKKQWKDQGERENKEENPRPRDMYVVKGIGELSTTLGKHESQLCHDGAD